jgi:hypothetical protein
MSATVLICIELKQLDSLCPFLFNFSVECDVKKAQVMAKIRYLYSWSCLLNENISTIKKNTETLLLVTKEISHESKMASS